MAHCPSCGKDISKPSRVAKNQFFTVEAYTCAKCNQSFKVTANYSYIV